ncbi:hypothetical protein K432DRAFT_454492 [Lepidopterella palustris CBS 459.81]|uniref:Uncharacterized protein n=1 Tax=Lepidopterella palustris CBS 459.81 TaxID=1314670 RepID=A0A8E2E9C4_9PEZI|nr:hypothetical protein K432DRAFT_454492 [Lepidopterella palustris CBS 459.81]
MMFKKNLLPEPELRDFDPYGELECDSRIGSCICINTGKNELGMTVKDSAKETERNVIYLLEHPQMLTNATKLYVIGDWNTQIELSHISEEMQNEVSDPWTVVSKEYNHDGKGSTALTLQETRTEALEELEWTKAVQSIAKVIEKMENLLELTWCSDLPFLGLLWSAISPNLEKLRTNIGVPVRFDLEDFGRPVYIQQEEMEPLTNLTKLKELRIFQMMESFQSIIWETVWKNQSEDKMMEILDLRMCLEPIVRSDSCRTDWIKAEKVEGVMKLGEGEVLQYRGLDGKGVLHHAYGHGEYLDILAIRKARLTAGVEETTPYLPLMKLALDGFVVDGLPFEKELAPVSLLNCRNKCYDAGITPRKLPHNDPQWPEFAWGYFILVWPNWMGVYDSHGFELDENGKRKNGEPYEEEDPDAILDLATGRLRQFYVSEPVKLAKANLALAGEGRGESPSEDESDGGVAIQKVKPLLKENSNGGTTVSEVAVSTVDEDWTKVSSDCSVLDGPEESSQDEVTVVDEAENNLNEIVVDRVRHV